jgi:hypothetical protein
MPILPSATVAHGRDQVGQLDLPVPDILLSPRDREDWQYYVSCLPPRRLIKKFAEAIDQFHALVHPIQDNPQQLSVAHRELILSKWNAAAAAASPCSERFGYELRPSKNNPCDIISEGLLYLDKFLESMRHPDREGWAGRRTYYNDLDTMIIQDIRDDYFNRQNDMRYGRKPRNNGFHPS